MNTPDSMALGDAEPLAVFEGLAPTSHEAMSALFVQHEERLYAFVLRRVGNPADAEDIAQQAFFEAVRTCKSFRGDSKPSTWLYGIALNLIRNHLTRAPRRVYRFAEDSALDDVASTSPSPPHQLEVTQSMRLLQAGLDELGPEIRDTLLMVALDEMSYQDVADALAIPIGTVRSRVSRARAYLRGQLEG
jgi:RNA polymerase sigma factor (sigma-70 family)